MLNGFNAAASDNLNFLLVGPNGSFLSQAGGPNAFGPLTVTVGDGATPAPQNSPLTANVGPASYGSAPSTYLPSPFYQLPPTIQ